MAHQHNAWTRGLDGGLEREDHAAALDDGPVFPSGFVYSGSASETAALEGSAISLEPGIVAYLADGIKEPV